MVPALPRTEKTIRQLDQPNALHRMQPRRARRRRKRQACKEKDIKNYPTWIINGQRYTGVQSLDTLAQMSKFNYQGGKP